MIYKSIIAGRLEFGNEKTFEKVLQMYEYRVENFYKTDLLIREEQFDPESFYLNIPRQVNLSEEKSWRNTVKLLEYLVQFAVAGTLRIWVIAEDEKREIVENRLIEPKTDKVAVQQYQRGKNLVDQAGKESEALDALNKAIEKYEKHALAYERRGCVNFQLRNYEDALYDFSKSIALNPNNAEPYFGRAMVHLAKKEPEEAVPDFQFAIKNSIPLQSMHWKARRLKGRTLLVLGQHEKAAQEFKFFSVRKFGPENPHFAWRKWVMAHWGICLVYMGQQAEAQKKFEAALAMKEGSEILSNADILLLRGKALKETGHSSFKKDWEDAAELGSEEAAELLASFA